MTKMDGQIEYKNVECKFFNPKKKKRKIVPNKSQASDDELVDRQDTSDSEEMKEHPEFADA